MKRIKIKGKVTEVGSGSKKLSKTKAYNYISVVIQVKYNESYLIFINYDNIEKYGFMPERNMLVLVEGIKSKDDRYNYPIIRNLSEFRHIEKKQQTIIVQ